MRDEEPTPAHPKYIPFQERRDASNDGPAHAGHIFRSYRLQLEEPMNPSCHHQETPRTHSLRL